MTLVLLSGILAAGVRLAMAIALAALGETVAQRSGVINVGLEGIMLVGAFLAAWGAVTTGTPWGGVACAIAGGCLLAAVHAWFCISLRADQIVTGIALVILGLGLSGFLHRITLGKAPASIPTIRAIDPGVLGEIPVIGPVVFGQNPLVYLTLVLAIVVGWTLRRTPLGLAIRACGESPEAAHAAGIAVTRVRYGAVIFGGALAGLAGAYLVLAQVNAFVENMVAGRGFIAIACVVFGRWRPLGVLCVAFVFGLLEATQIRLQTFFPDIPFQFFVILPYAGAVVALALLARSAALPRALGQPYPAS